jgi:actin-like ATPase involved in cell morphogenesis
LISVPKVSDQDSGAFDRIPLIRSRSAERLKREVGTVAAMRRGRHEQAEVTSKRKLTSKEVTSKEVTSKRTTNDERRTTND